VLFFGLWIALAAKTRQSVCLCLSVSVFVCVCLSSRSPRRSHIRTNTLTLYYAAPFSWRCRFLQLHSSEHP